MCAADSGLDRPQNPSLPRLSAPLCCTGAFPEIQVAQYPLEMGKSDQKSSTKTLATTVGADGNINFDAIVKQGRNKDKHIASSHNAMVPKLDKLKDDVSLLLVHREQDLLLPSHHTAYTCSLSVLMLVCLTGMLFIRVRRPCQHLLISHPTHVVVALLQSMIRRRRGENSQNGPGVTMTLRTGCAAGAA